MAATESVVSEINVFVSSTGNFNALALDHNEEVEEQRDRWQLRTSKFFTSPRQRFRAGQSRHQDLAPCE